jgi:DNA-binding NarL/FixJ family response regulator
MTTNLPTTNNGHVRVALVEDDEGTRGRLSRVIQSNAALSLVCAAATAAEILAWLPAHELDVLLVDLGLPDMPGLEVIRRCRVLRPECEVMVITMFGDEANILRAIENGARGYLLKDGTEADLATHVLQLRAGGSPMTPIIARQLLTRWAAEGAQPTAIAAASPLSMRERDVLDLLARGFTYTETAQQLGIALSTVHTHVTAIYRKLDVHNKAEAVFEARQLGWLR